MKLLAIGPMFKGGGITTLNDDPINNSLARLKLNHSHIYAEFYWSIEILSNDIKTSLFSQRNINMKTEKDMLLRGFIS